MTSDDNPLIQTIDARGVCTLILNRPSVYNALDDDLIERLLSALQQVRTRTEVRLLVLTGMGSYFSAGADLHWLAESCGCGPERFEQLLETLDDITVPTLVLINGPAYGGAIGLVAACDIALASADVHFVFSEVRLGIVPSIISPYVVRAIGRRQAGRWFLSGAGIDANTAQRMGLVHDVVAKSELMQAAETEIGYLLAAGPAAQREVKTLLHPRDELSPVGAETPAELLSRVCASPEGTEGIRAFLQKRKPQWSGG